MTKPTKSWCSVLLSTVALLSICQSPLLAQETPDHVVEYVVREDPDDITSDTLMIVTLELWISEATETSIGWDVGNVRFTKPGQSGEPDTTWMDHSPRLTTTDGLWWTEHEDPQQITAAEFNELPYVEGVALADDPAEEDLDYDIQGHGETVIQSAPTATASRMTYAFSKLQSSQLLVEGEEDPVEVDPDATGI